jgi:hypothetical protein
VDADVAPIPARTRGAVRANGKNARGLAKSSAGVCVSLLANLTFNGGARSILDKYFTASISLRGSARAIAGVM